MVGALKFENKPLTIRWYLLTTCNTTSADLARKRPYILTILV